MNEIVTKIMQFVASASEKVVPQLPPAPITAEPDNFVSPTFSPSFNESRFQKIAANIPGIIFQALHRPDGTRSLLWMSSGCEKLLDIKPNSDHCDICQFWNLIHPDDLSSYEESVKQAAADLQRWNWEGRVITPTGKLKWVQCASSPEMQANGDILWDGLVMDITERKWAESQLQATGKRDRLLAEIALKIRNSLNLQEILNTTVTEIHQFIKADRVFICLFEESGRCKTVAESVGNWPSILDWVTDETAFDQIQPLFESNQVCVVDDTNLVESTPFLKEYHHRYHVKAGICVPIILDKKLFGLLIANQCDSPRQWQQFEVELLEYLTTQVTIAIQQSLLFKQLSDLTASLEYQVRERTAQLQEKCTQLEEINRIKDVVLYTVAHELRTSVLGAALLFKNWLQKPGEMIAIPRCLLQKLLRGNEQQLERINALIETDLSGNKQICLQPEPVFLHKLLADILPDLQPVLQKNQANLSSLVGQYLPAIMADTGLLKQVFTTLLTHRLQQNPLGLALQIAATIEGGKLRCQIWDNGMGISQLECQRFFDLYIREPQNPCLMSAGLKLYHCRQIITALGGEIGVESSADVGFSFWFTLPIIGNC